MNQEFFTELGLAATRWRRLFDLLADLRRAAGDFPYRRFGI